MCKVKKLDDYKPIAEIYSLFYAEKESVLLESSLINKLGQYSIIGRSPYLKIEKDNEMVKVNGEIIDLSFEQYVDEYYKANYTTNNTSLPIIAGAIGYFSYDFNQRKKNEIPESILIFYDEFIIEDHYEREVYLVANGKQAEAGHVITNLEKMINEISSEVIRENIGENIGINVFYDFNRNEYSKAISKMIQYIIEGDIYIANMTQQISVESNLTPYILYNILREINPSPFASILNYEDFQVISASPERFIKVKDRKIITRPIKGTRKRGATEKEDLKLKEELKNSKKDKSELLMIVDLERNDLNKICKPGTVKVDNLFTIESYATVHHLVAEVSGVLEDDQNLMDIIHATFPGGSITGAPKIRAMEIIDQLEHSQRGLYTGSIGYFSLNGDCDSSIVIRTAVYKNAIFKLGVGGGITYESDVDMEYEETIQKALAFMNAFGGMRNA